MPGGEEKEIADFIEAFGLRYFGSTSDETWPDTKLSGSKATGSNNSNLKKVVLKMLSQLQESIYSDDIEDEINGIDSLVKAADEDTSGDSQDDSQPNHGEAFTKLEQAQKDAAKALNYLLKHETYKIKRGKTSTFTTMLSQLEIKVSSMWQKVGVKSPLSKWYSTKSEADQKVKERKYEEANTKIDGIIAANTTTSRENLKTDAKTIELIANGGLSGKPVTKRSTEVIKYLSEKSLLYT